MEKYEKLRQMLLENKNWPLLYMFKFIVPNNDNKVDRVVDLLPGDGKKSFKHTKNLKYVSVTCTAYMSSADSIIEVTSEVSKIEGVMSL